MESFEEFLKKNSPLSYCGDLMPVILVQDLGEWAWSVWRKTELDWKDAFPIEYRNYRPKNATTLANCSYLGEIAVACLGKAEIEKRLKALNEKDKKSKTKKEKFETYCIDDFSPDIWT